VGDAATEQNNWAYDYLPKLDKLYDMLQVYELMHQGKIKRLSRPGLSIRWQRRPTRPRSRRHSRSSKFLVIMDPLATETLGVLAQLRRLNDV